MRNNMNIISEYLSNKKYLFSIVGVCIFFIAASAFIYSRQNNPIVGTWIGLHSSKKYINKYSWTFTSNNEFKRYFGGQLTKYNKYKLSKTPNHCGVDMSKRLQMHPKNLILILKDTETEKKQCYLVYKLTNKRLVLSAFRNAHIDTLKKVQQ